MMNIFNNLVFILSVVLLNFSVNSVSEPIPQWDGHDISTLKLLQIVHRHGERTVLKNNIPLTDPFKNVNEFWPEGYGQLTTAGKNRMYTMGQYLREWYVGWLDPHHSPRLVYARSSIEHRCIESVSALLAGMYPPKGEWNWQQTGFGQEWQPFPIETFMPKDEDTVLVPHKPCPKAQEEHNRINELPDVKKIMNDLHSSKIYDYMKKTLFQESIDYLYKGQQFWDTLTIEKEHNLTWPQLNKSNNNVEHSQKEIIDALEPLGIGSYVYDWNKPFILKIRLGKLIETLISNMKSALNPSAEPEDRKELYIYSTHDSILVPLMQAFGAYNKRTPPYGGALLIELHEQNHSKFVRIYYYNETKKAPFPFMGVNTSKSLSFEEFESSNKQWYYTDFDKECGLEKPSLILSEMTFMVIGIGIGIGLLGLNIFAFKYIRQRKNTFQVSK